LGLGWPAGTAKGGVYGLRHTLRWRGRASQGDFGGGKGIGGVITGAKQTQFGPFSGRKRRFAVRTNPIKANLCGRFGRDLQSQMSDGRSEEERSDAVIIRAKQSQFSAFLGQKRGSGEKAKPIKANFAGAGGGGAVR
jgi:hypothetical protein